MRSPPGHNTSDVVIGVTSGALHVLNRDELQGVLAHEFSHIHNGDMRLNMRITGIVHGVYSVALMSYAIMILGQEREVEDKTIIEIVLDLARGRPWLSGSVHWLQWRVVRTPD